MRRLNSQYQAARGNIRDFSPRASIQRVQQANPDIRPKDNFTPLNKVPWELSQTFYKELTQLADAEHDYLDCSKERRTDCVEVRLGPMFLESGAQTNDRYNICTKIVDQVAAQISTSGEEIVEEFRGINWLPSTKMYGKEQATFEILFNRPGPTSKQFLQDLVANGISFKHRDSEFRLGVSWALKPRRSSRLICIRYLSSYFERVGLGNCVLRLLQKIEPIGRARILREFVAPQTDMQGIGMEKGLFTSVYLQVESEDQDWILPYTYILQLGTGSDGRVYIAQEGVSQQEAVLELCRREQRQKDQAAQRQRDEAKKEEREKKQSDSVYRRQEGGVCIDGVDSEGRCSPLIVKEKGKVVQLEELIKKTCLKELKLNMSEVVPKHIGIAHTRWATHGPPSQNNSHPHQSDDDKEFVLVHNGTITNYKALKDFLTNEGMKFYSDTDTEVIAKLFKYVSGKSPEGVSFAEVAIEVTKMIEGAYALLVKSTRYPLEMIACKKGSPLIMGIQDSPALNNTNSAPLTREAVRQSSKKEQAAAEGSPQSNCSSDVSSFSFNQSGDLPEMKNLKSIKTASSSSSNVVLTPRAMGTPRNIANQIMAYSETARSQQIMDILEGEQVEYYFGSDASAIVEHTRKVIVLEDYDVVHIQENAYQIYDSQQNQQTRISRIMQTLDIEVGQIMKGGYDHFMQKEIHEQPETVLQSMAGRVWMGPIPEKENPYVFQHVLLGGIKDKIKDLRQGKRFIMIACGTSYHACLACRQTIEELVEVPVSLELASDLLDRRACPIFRDDICVFVSQSGETADTLQCLKIARNKGALCVGVTNTVGSAIARATDCGIHINAGCEIGVASTKAYTSQIVVMTMMALALSHDSVSKNERRGEIISSLQQLSVAIKQVLQLDEYIKKLAESLKSSDNLLVLGRGYNYATALETALKIKEVSLIHSEGILAGEIKHGPLALVDETIPAIVFCTKDLMYQKMHGVIQQLLARNGKLVVVCNEGDTYVRDICKNNCILIEVPQVVDALQPVVNIVPMQLLSYHLTVQRGHNVDQPRNLAKSVTVCEE